MSTIRWAAPRAAAVLLTLAATLLAGCASGSSAADPNQTGTGAAKPVLRVGGFDATKVELAKRSGIWDDAPYQLELSKANYSSEAAALLNDQLDLAGFAATTSVFLQASQGQSWTAETAPIKVVTGFRAPPNRTYPKGFIGVRTDSGINTAADLKGKTWGVVEGDNGQWLAALQAAGLTKNDIKVYESDSNTALVAAFRKGDIDVFSSYPELIPDLFEQGKVKVLYSVDELGIAWFPTWAVQAKALADPAKEPLIRDFLTRIEKYEVDWYDQNSDVVKDVLVNVGQLTDAAADFVINQHKGTRAIKLDEAVFTGVRKTVDLLSGNGDIAAVKDVTVTYDNRYAETLNSVEYAYK